MTHYVQVLVLGGGAAGLMCAATAGQRGRQVLVLEKSNKLGKKILMSGGGRCNFTNLNITHDHYLSRNPHFCKSALKRYTQFDFINLVESYGLKYHEKKLGQLFCDGRAKELLSLLLNETQKGNVELKTHTLVSHIEPFRSSQHEQSVRPRFRLQSEGQVYTCDSLVIATGGPSIPSLGASGFGYQVASDFGHALVPPVAALVPFVLRGRGLKLAQKLAGVALDVEVNCVNQSFREGLLFTHKGLSGPAVLQISSYWSPGEPIRVSFLPELNLQDQIHQWQLQGERSSLTNLLARLLPKRFVEAWLEQLSLQKAWPERVEHLTHEQVNLLVRLFQDWHCYPQQTEGYKTAEVTRGGVSTEAISSKTFESKRVPGLYFIGEVVDVTGWLGGYNFQWAWSSGWCAGQYV